MYPHSNDATRAIYREDGIRGFFRGMSLPLAGTIIETSVLFTTNGMLKRMLSQAGHIAPEEELPMQYVGIAGAGTGFVVSWVLTPTELVKCRLQVPAAKEAAAHLQYSGPIDCLAKSIRTEGLRVLYRGHVGTLLREVPGTMFWFSAYELFVRAMTPLGTKREDLPSSTIIAGGALGGMAYWAVMYPCDTVKSAMQLMHDENPPIEQQQQQAKAAGTSSSSPSSSSSAAPATSAAGSCSSNSSAAVSSGTAKAAASQQLSSSSSATSSLFSNSNSVAASSASSTSSSSGGGAHLSGTGIRPGLSQPLLSSKPGVAAFSTTTSAAASSSSSSVGGAAVGRPHLPGFGEVLMQMYRRGGIRGLYSGFVPTIIRAAPSNAAIFFVYEWSAKRMKELTGWDRDDDAALQ